MARDTGTDALAQALLDSETRARGEACLNVARRSLGARKVLLCCLAGPELVTAIECDSLSPTPMNLLDRQCEAKLSAEPVHLRADKTQSSMASWVEAGYSWLDAQPVLDVDGDAFGAVVALSSSQNLDVEHCDRVLVTASNSIQRLFANASYMRETTRSIRDDAPRIGRILTHARQVGLCFCLLDRYTDLAASSGIERVYRIIHALAYLCVNRLPHRPRVHAFDMPRGFLLVIDDASREQAVTAGNEVVRIVREANIPGVAENVVGLTVSVGTVHASAEHNALSLSRLTTRARNAAIDAQDRGGDRSVFHGKSGDQGPALTGHG